MDFAWAMKQLTEGQKVRRDHWFEGQYYVMGECGIELCNEETAQIYTTEILATDWVLFKEPKPFNLSDNSIGIKTDGDLIGVVSDEYYHESKVKEFIKQVKEGIKNKNYHQDCIDEISELIDELVGDRFKE